MHRAILPTVLIVLGMGIPQAVSQQTNKAFDRITVGAGLGYSSPDKNLSERWNTGPGYQVNLGTPFYAGNLEGGLRYTRFKHTSEFPAYSDFHNTFIYLGLSYSFKIFDRVKAGPAIRFGNTFFHFDEAKTYPNDSNTFVYEFDSNESEFAYELNLHTEYLVTGNWKAQAAIVYNRTMTYRPIGNVFFTLGLAYTFDSPAFFQKVLQ